MDVLGKRDHEREGWVVPWGDEKEYENMNLMDEPGKKDHGREGWYAQVWKEYKNM